MTKTITPADVLRAHVRDEVTGGWCLTCRGDWPCDAVQMAEALAAAEAEIERLRDRVRTICRTYAEPCSAVVCTGESVHIHGTAEEVAAFLLDAALTPESTEAETTPVDSEE